MFRGEADDEVFAGLFRRVLADTLDATSRKGAEAAGPQTQARQDVKFYRESMLGERSWWRIAWTPDGQLAGFGIPSQNTECPVVGYLGVLPEHRGHGYVDEILAEITRILAAETGAAAIRGDTDLENLPMLQPLSASATGTSVAAWCYPRADHHRSRPATPIRTLQPGSYPGEGYSHGA